MMVPKKQGIKEKQEVEELIRGQQWNQVW
jgi:hypothetical protein